MPTDEERIAYLAGEPADSLSAQERAELDTLRIDLGGDAVWTDPDPALEDRVVAAITDAAAVAPGRPRRASRPRWTLRWPMVAVGSLAAAAAAAVVVAIAVNGGGPAPQRLAMVVSGTNLAPAVRGYATLTKTGSGWRIALSAAGLPHLANGRYYEAWLENSAGVLVAVGTFNDATNVILWAGVPATRFPTLTVTVQRANGDSRSSGIRVLRGTIRAQR